MGLPGGLGGSLGSGTVPGVGAGGGTPGAGIGPGGAPIGGYGPGGVPAGGYGPGGVPAGGYGPGSGGMLTNIILHMQLRGSVHFHFYIYSLYLTLNAAYPGGPKALKYGRIF